MNRFSINKPTKTWQSVVAKKRVGWQLSVFPSLQHKWHSGGRRFDPVQLHQFFFRSCSHRRRENGVVGEDQTILEADMCNRRGDKSERVSTMPQDDDLKNLIKGAEASAEFFGPAKERHKASERYVVEQFLRGLGVAFDPTEIQQLNDDPPDAVFRDAAFEVKEIQDPGRRRHDEYKQHLERARSARSRHELLELFTPGSDMPIAKVCDRILAATRDLALRKYRDRATRRDLDLLFYVNLDVCGIADGPSPDLEPLTGQGWRSVSFLFNNSACCVLFARPDAAAFLRQAEGQLLRIADPET
jgi:hypothetical protein